MKELVKVEYSESPKSVGLEEATDYNQRAWRKRDHFLSVSAPIEVPAKYTEPVFDKVLDTFGKYIGDGVSLKVKPLVGYSVFPETLVSFDGGYYFPNIGKYRSVGLLDEFAVDWLTRIVYGEDPFRANYYLGAVNTRIEKDPWSPENIFLTTIIGSLKRRDVSKKMLTNLFAKYIISGDLDMLYSAKILFPDGREKSYKYLLDKVKTKDDILKKTQTIKFHGIDAAVARPAMFLASSTIQISRINGGVLGQTGFPGVVNLCGLAFSSSILAHEYIHTLSFHERTWGGLPIKGYTLMASVVID